MKVADDSEDVQIMPALVSDVAPAIIAK